MGMLLHHFVGCGDGQNEDLATRHMATVGCRSYYSSLLGADLGTLTLVCVFPFRFPSPSPESHVVASQGRLLSEFHCSGQMCGHNLINVRLCHCFFLCSVATCRDNLVARPFSVFVLCGSHSFSIRHLSEEVKGVMCRTSCIDFFLLPGTGQTRDKSFFSVQLS